jgi:hypothetical protein
MRLGNADWRGFDAVGGESAGRVTGFFRVDEREIEAVDGWIFNAATDGTGQKAFRRADTAFDFGYWKVHDSAKRRRMAAVKNFATRQSG